MKRQTVAQKKADLAVAIRQIRDGTPVKRETRRDGSLLTSPIIPVPDKVEADVLSECLTWFKRKNILCDRNNTGSGTLGASGFYHYGIKNGGDIIGVLPNGIHFEVECKRGKGGSWSAGQQKRCQDIVSNNGLYFIVHGVEELEIYFRGLHEIKS